MSTSQKRLDQIAFMYFKGKKEMQFALKSATKEDIKNLSISVYDSLDVISESEADDFARAMLVKQE